MSENKFKTLTRGGYAEDRVEEDHPSYGQPEKPLCCDPEICTECGAVCDHRC